MIEFSLQSDYIKTVTKKREKMTTFETVLFIMGWSLMIGIFDYLESK